jgi:hypothetical protein
MSDEVAKTLVRIEASLGRVEGFYGGRRSAVEKIDEIEWPAPGFEDTELGVLLEPEMAHGEAEVYAGVQAWGCSADQRGAAFGQKVWPVSDIAMLPPSIRW